ncbi:MAG: hypothetical protein NPIRA04_04790 [Nitrospirales bacterium]|nr:MAG: hypothetical protein NPIRA04_04790 [Nitrospirales bacterium]
MLDYKEVSQSYPLPKIVNFVNSETTPLAFADTAVPTDRQAHISPAPLVSQGMKSFIQYRWDVSQMGNREILSNGISASDVRQSLGVPYPQLAYVPGRAYRDSSGLRDGSEAHNSIKQGNSHSTPQSTGVSSKTRGTDIPASQPIQAQLVSRQTVGIVADRVYDLLVERVKRERSLFRR